MKLSVTFSVHELPTSFTEVVDVSSDDDKLITEALNKRISVTGATFESMPLTVKQILLVVQQ